MYIVYSLSAIFRTVKSSIIVSFLFAFAVCLQIKISLDVLNIIYRSNKISIVSDNFKMLTF